MEKILEPPSTATLVRAMEDNRCTLCTLFARLPGAELHDAPDVLQVTTNEPFSVFNTVHRAQFAPKDVDTAIEAAKTRARARGVRLMWLVGPSTRPADLGDSLQAHGFVHEEDIFGMATDLSRLPDDRELPAGVEIREATGEQDLRTWSTTMVSAFGMPESVVDTYIQWLLPLTTQEHSPVHLYIGWLDGVAVATQLLVLGAGVAGIHYLGTLPSARGRGVGGAVCLNTLREGRARGYRIGVTEAETMAVGTCRRLGLKEYYTVSVYIWKGDATGGRAGRRSRTKAIASAIRRARPAGDRP